MAVGVHVRTSEDNERENQNGDEKRDNDRAKGVENGIGSCGWRGRLLASLHRTHEWRERGGRKLMGVVHVLHASRTGVFAGEPMALRPDPLLPRTIVAIGALLNVFAPRAVVSFAAIGQARRAFRECITG